MSLHLSDRYHVYTLDQRGHGDSEWSHDLDYTIDTMAEDAGVRRGSATLTGTIIFGHSMGGRVTLDT